MLRALTEVRAMRKKENPMPTLDKRTWWERHYGDYSNELAIGAILLMFAMGVAMHFGWM